MSNERQISLGVDSHFEQILHEWEDRMRASWQDRQRRKQEGWRGYMTVAERREFEKTPFEFPPLVTWQEQLDDYAGAEGREQQRREQEGFEAAKLRVWYDPFKEVSQ
jgi:hypothetical protein